MIDDSKQALSDMEDLDKLWSAVVKGKYTKSMGELDAAAADLLINEATAVAKNLDTMLGIAEATRPLMQNSCGPKKSKKK